VATDLFLHAYEVDFLKEILKNKDRKIALTFNSSFRYVDNDYLRRIYPNELEVNATTDIRKSAFYVDLHIDIDNRRRNKTLRKT